MVLICQAASFSLTFIRAIPTSKCQLLLSFPAFRLLIIALQQRPAHKTRFLVIFAVLMMPIEGRHRRFNELANAAAAIGRKSGTIRRERVRRAARDSPPLHLYFSPRVTLQLER